MLNRSLMRRYRLGVGLAGRGFLRPPAAVTPTVLTEGESTADAAFFDTASFSVAAGVPVYAAIISRVTGGPNVATGSGHGTDWVVVQSGLIGTTIRLTVLVAHPRAAATGVLRFDFASQSQTSAVWTVAQAAGAARYPTRQSTINSAASGTGNGIALTGTLGHARHAVLAWTGLNTDAAVTGDTDFTELSDRGVGTSACAMELSWATNQSRCDVTFATAVSGMVIAEVRGAA